MASHTHFFIVPFAVPAGRRALADRIVACGSASEATARAEQMAGYVEYGGAIAVRARSRDGKLTGEPTVLASYGAVEPDVGALLRAHAL